MGRYDFNTGDIIKDTTEEKIKENDDEKVTELKSNVDSPTNNVKIDYLWYFDECPDQNIMKLCAIGLKEFAEIFDEINSKFSS